MWLFAPFIVQNYKKNFKSRSRVLRTQHFLAQKNPFTLNKIFFCKNRSYKFLMTLGSFHCAKFKKILETHHELRGCVNFHPKWPICPKRNFFGKIINTINMHNNFGSKMAHLPQPGIFLEKSLV